MKLQACSKVITLNAIGFTLCAAGSLFTLSSAQQSIDDTYKNKVQSAISSANSDLIHYVHRIDNDYYQLVNMSLSNVLSLNREVYLKDPLLSFFERNIRAPSSYSNGEYLKYALDALNYYKIPYACYDLKSKELEVFGIKDEKLKSRLLKAHTQDGATLEDLIKQPSALTQSFSIMYSGSDTYLCLKIFDQGANKNYYVFSSYLTVLENTNLDVKKIFSDIDPMMQDILKDDAVMIVRRGQTVFKTNQFDLNLDSHLNNLRSMVGVRIVDSHGNTVSDPTKLSSSDNASVLGVSYLRSINSYIILKRPFTTYYESDSLLLTARIALVILCLVFMGLITREILRSYRDDKREFKHVASLVNRLTNIPYDTFLVKFNEAHQAYLEHKAKQNAAASTCDTLAEDTNASAASATSDAADANASATDSAANNVETNENATAAQDGSTADTSAATANSNNSALEDNKQALESVEGIAKAVDTKLEKNSKGHIDAAKAETESAQVKADNDDEGAEHIDENNDISLMPTEKLSEEAINFIENYILEDLLKNSGVEADSITGEALLGTIHIALSAELKSSQQISELKTEFKNRIPIFRKEGQFIAARKMLLNTLPSEDAMPSSNFVDFAAFTVPARELSGNFYLIRRIDENNLAFIIGDCCSMGIKAAYTATVIKTLVDEALRLSLDPPNMMSYINDRLCKERNVASVGLFISIISEMTGNVIACNAGHTSPIVIDDNGPHFMCEPNDKRLGRNQGETFELSKCYLANNDMVLLYSQGIVNVRNSNDELFGMERLLDHCENSAGLRADELIIRILNDIKQHKGKRPFREDVSLISFKQLRIRF